MDVINDDAKTEYRRVEVLTGPTRRRRWSAEEKGLIVAETLRSGATVTEVARRKQVCPQQVWGWRRQAREGRLTLPAEAAEAADAGGLPSFVPIVMEAPSLLSATGRAERRPEAETDAGIAPGIEIRLAGAVVRVSVGTDPTLLGEVLRAVRVSAR
jgi:transposase